MRNATLNNIFFILLLISLAGLILGLIKPGFISRVFHKNLTRKHIGIIFGVFALAFWVGTIMSFQSQDKAIQYIQELQDSDPHVRFDAAYALGNIGDPRAVEPLINSLKDSDPSVASMAASALADINDPRAVEPLIEVLQSADQDLRTAAINALSEIGDARSVQALIALLNNTELKWQAAWQLADMDPVATSALMDALNSHNLEVVASTYPFFIMKGAPGTEPTLIDALNNYGSKTMAEDYMNCENAQLESAALSWAESHGYTTTSQFGVPYGSSSSAGARWGQAS
jgi:hypothetical protein